MASATLSTTTVSAGECELAVSAAGAGGSTERPRVARDVALDLLRGLSMVILVVNHVHLDSALEYVTAPFLSAAEALVLLSGVVCGIVFRERWEKHGPRTATALLLRRSCKLYVASVVVVVVVGALRYVPGLATDALTIAPGSGINLYEVDGVAGTALAVATLAVGPWQFDVLGFFVAALALAPVVLWALDRGAWLAVLVSSVGLYLVGRFTMLEVLPSMSERPFPLLIWQVLFVPGMVLGWHRPRVERAVHAALSIVVTSVISVALVAAYLRLHEIGLDPLGLDALIGFGPGDWTAWDRAHFNKSTLDPARLLSMVSFTAAAYLLLRRFEASATRTLGPVLIPLGRNSFYVFIMQVFVCLAVASIPALAEDGIGVVGNTAVQVACLALLCLMVRQRFLFRYVPR